jgi:hypothetical protein
VRTGGTAATILRGVAALSGVAARYFSESFASIEELQVAAFDQITAEVEAQAMAAIAAASGGPKAQARAALGAVTDLLLDDRQLLDIPLTAQFVLNGVAGALTAVLTGEINTDRGYLVDRLTDLLFTTINGVRSPQKLG